MATSDKFSVFETVVVKPVHMWRKSLVRGFSGSGFSCRGFESSKAKLSKSVFVVGWTRWTLSEAVWYVCRDSRYN
jgi:hypothetical protein